MITEERLAEILLNPKAIAYFQTLDVDVTESAALFSLLDNGDGEITLEAGTAWRVQHGREIRVVAFRRLPPKQLLRSLSTASCAAKGQQGPSTKWCRGRVECMAVVEVVLFFFGADGVLHLILANSFNSFTSIYLLIIGGMQISQFHLSIAEFPACVTGTAYRWGTLVRAS